MDWKLEKDLQILYKIIEEQLLLEMHTQEYITDFVEKTLSELSDNGGVL